ncbi:hypothetical protein LguiA_002012 [Lonicera macranthoides]
MTYEFSQVKLKVNIKFKSHPSSQIFVSAMHVSPPRRIFSKELLLHLNITSLYTR